MIVTAIHGYCRDLRMGQVEVIKIGRQITTPIATAQLDQGNALSTTVET